MVLGHVGIRGPVCPSEGLQGSGLCWGSGCVPRAMAGGRLKDGDREALERSGCFQPCCPLSRLGGEVVRSPAPQLTAS